MPAAYRESDGVGRGTDPLPSTRRCRHFLAAIAPQLLAAIAATPDPDATLVNLSQVSDSLGGKAVLWELFSFNRPSLEPVRHALRGLPLPVGHPDQQSRDDRRTDGQPGAGQAADARDAAKLNWRICPRRRRHRTDPAQLQERAASARRRPRHPGQGRHSGDAPGTGQRRRGLRAANHRARVSASGGEVRRARSWGHSTPAQSEQRPIDVRGCLAGGEVSEFVILALGKLGGREPNYHSDLDLVFLFEADGMTRHRDREKGKHDDQLPLFRRAGTADHSSDRPRGSATADCTRSTCDCGLPARAVPWRFRSVRYGDTSPRGLGSSGNVNRSQGAPHFRQQADREDRVEARSIKPLTADPGSRGTPRRSAGCGTSSKKPHRRET